MRFSGKTRGEPSAELTPQAFVAFIQNHDQVGNRALGDRIGMIAAPEAVRAIAAVYLLLPQVPMLFMGEEWNASQPFPFFCDFSGDLARAVSEGRRKEFAAFPEFQDPEKRETIPDPQAHSTFESAKLDWSALSEAGHANCLEWYQRVLRARREVLWPRVTEFTRGGEYSVLAPGAVRVRWPGRSDDLALEANLSHHALDQPLLTDATEIWREGLVGETLGRWSVRWSFARRSPSAERRAR
jgi:maltooligosyltrehalose trehalohydrolase